MLRETGNVWHKNQPETTEDGEKEIQADSVITSIGYIPGSGFDTKNVGHLHVIGDAATIGNLKTAIWAADDLVLELSK
ncbi:MAG: hypothetical protein LBK04_01035 [Clostridiales Family XIII bacterium]|jgi:2-enoate reductase|nr:hypothetical protein [Clostridiales Family XIII bacterium]